MRSVWLLVARRLEVRPASPERRLDSSDLVVLLPSSALNTLLVSSVMVSVTPFMSVPTLPSSVLRLVTSLDSSNTAENKIVFIWSVPVKPRNRSFPLVISVMVSSSRLCRKGAFLSSFPRLCKKVFLKVSSDMVFVTPFMSMLTLHSSDLRLVTSPDSSNMA